MYIMMCVGPRLVSAECGVGEAAAGPTEQESPAGHTPRGPGAPLLQALCHGQCSSHSY